MNPLNLKKTNTTRFLLAMIFNDDVIYNEILTDIYLNSYTYDFYVPENDGYLIVVSSTKEEPKNTITKPIRSYQRNSKYIFVYDIPTQYKKDYNILINGNFKNVSAEYKSKLLRFWNEPDDSELYELLKYISKSTEIYKYNKFEEVYRISDDN